MDADKEFTELQKGIAWFLVAVVLFLTAAILGVGYLIFLNWST